MKNFNQLLITIIITLILLSTATSQVIMQRVETGSGDIFLLQELSVVISGNDDSLHIQAVLSLETRPEKYKDIIVKEGDQILMMNAKRMKSVKQIKEMYESVAIGEEIKFGIKRDDEMRIISFNKIDPEELPKNRRILIRTAGDNEAKPSEKEQGKKIVLRNSGDNIQPLLDVGLILEEANKLVKIAELLPHINQAIGNVDLQKGDVINSINNEQVGSLKQFLEIYHKVGIGDMVQLKLVRNDKTLEVTFKKPAEAKKTVILK